MRRSLAKEGFPRSCVSPWEAEHTAEHARRGHAPPIVADWSAIQDNISLLLSCSVYQPQTGHLCDGLQQRKCVWEGDGGLGSPVHTTPAASLGSQSL